MSRLPIFLLAVFIGIFPVFLLFFVAPKEVQAVNYRKGTVAMWVKPNWDGNDGNTYFIFQGNALSSTDDNSIKLYKDSLNFIHGEVWGNDGAWGDVPPGDVSQTSTDQWRSGVWHHVALSWDSSEVEIKLYIDGALRGMTDSEDISEEEFPTLSQGSDFEGVYRDSSSYSFDGEITEVRKYDSPQSDSTIASLASTSPAERATVTADEEAAAAAAVAAIDQSSPTFSSIGSITTYFGATITWTTNEAANSQVEYGLTTSYGMSSLLSTTSVESHRVTLTGLKPSTTYHFVVKSKDGSDNLGISSDNTFTTATPAVPTITLRDLGYKITKNTVLEFSGVASSAIDSQIELSVDGGSTWFLDQTRASGSRGYSFVVSDLKDGNYRVVTKVTDDIGQVTVSSSFEIVVDTIPPRLGGYSFFLGPQKVFPSENGALVLASGSTLSIVVSAVGGPVKVQVKAQEDVFDLSRIKGTNLWEGEITFEQSGSYDLEATSEDGARNVVGQELSAVSVLPRGVVRDASEPVNGAVVSIYVPAEDSANPSTGEWQLWDGMVFGQENPQFTDKSGEYFALLPRGTYQLVVKRSGFRDFVSQPFTIEQTTPFSPLVILEPRPNVSLFGRRIAIPWYLDFLAKKHEVALDIDVVETGAVDLGIGNSAAGFSLPTASGGEVGLGGYSGRKVVLSFWSTWDPLASEQIAVLNEVEKPRDVVFLPIAVQESAGRVVSFLRRGGYLLESLVDEDGDLLDDYRFLSFPQHVLIGEDGRIKKVKAGVLSKEEILNFVEI